MSRVEIVLPTEDHIESTAANARTPDIAELWAAGRSTPRKAMEQGIKRSSLAWAGLIDDEPVCLFGVCPRSTLSDVGVPWMVGSHKIDTHQIAFLRGCRECVQDMRKAYSMLVNYVDDRNVMAKRWLHWCGFSLDAPKPYGFDHLPFCRFEMKGLAYV